MKKHLIFLVIVALPVLLQIGTLGAASLSQSAPKPTSETFSWSVWNGELVSLDQTSRILTVKSMVVGNALDEVGHFKTGDRVMLGWSGFDKYANAINHAVRYDATRKLDERFAFPAEFVSFDATKKYLTFKSQIPAESISKLQPLKAGEWVTATSPHGKSSEAQPIVAIRPYNEPASNS